MTETAERAAVDDQVRDVLQNADAPLTAGEVAEALGRSSKAETRKVLETMGAVSRTLRTPGAGRKPVAFALSDEVLSVQHSAETTPAPARPARKTARKSAAGKARTVAASQKKRASTARAATKRTSSARAETGEQYEATPYTAPDGAPIVAKDGQLYVVRPLLEQA
jgi:predicted ArsR family transcriptional regulator